MTSDNMKDVEIGHDDQGRPYPILPLIPGKEADAQGRTPLSMAHHIYFLYGVEVHGVFSFQCRSLSRSERKWKAALARVCSKNVNLARRIVGDWKKSWTVPTEWKGDMLDKLISFHYPEHIDDPKELDDYVNGLVQEKLKEFEYGGKDVCRNPVYFMVAFGKNHQFSIGCLSCHAFCDGQAYASVGAMLVAYVFLRRPFWFWAERFMAKQTPDIVEMTLKADYDRIAKKYDGDLSKVPDLTSGGGNDTLYEFPLDKSVPNVHWSGSFDLTMPQVKQLKKDLRIEGLTLTPVFLALASKIFAHILDSRGMADDRSKHLYPMTPFDVRKMGKWGNRRDRRFGFPEVGDYVGTLYSKIPMEDALTKPVTHSAHVIRKDVERLKTDPEYRLSYVLHDDPPVLQYVLGTTSFIMPATDRLKRLGFRNVSTIGDFDVASMGMGEQYVWTYLISYGERMLVQCEVALPIPGLQPKDIETVVQEAVQGSPLEKYFVNLKTDASTK